MAPAEIWQGGKKVNMILGNNMHIGKLNGVEVLVKDSNPGCQLSNPDGEYVQHSYLGSGESITLDGGEIVKSVRT